MLRSRRVRSQGGKEARRPPSRDSPATSSSSSASRRAGGQSSASRCFASASSSTILRAREPQAPQAIPLTTVIQRALYRRMWLTVSNSNRPAPQVTLIPLAPAIHVSHTTLAKDAAPTTALVRARTTVLLAGSPVRTFGRMHRGLRWGARAACGPG
jgi:hypothetical protein